MTARTILIADDHPLFRQALKLAVGRAAPDATILEAGQLGEAIEAARGAARLDLILLDLRMPGSEGFAGVALLHAERPDTPIVVISSADEAEAAPRARAYGAVGFVSKTADLATLENAVARALAGDRDAPVAALPADDISNRVASLTPTELKVLLGVLAGRLNKQIAFDLGVSEATVKGHMTAILRKLGVQNRTQAVLAARALDIRFAD
ncbi:MULTISPECIES: response regulator transcription factor [unclassified Sphingomonas]|jgi:DNA-binding NarL/FixJ family response regulator|uniref:response regulator transcription factor n=1 Tax=unclassified Sphingomonas TaxID=196159 RepID=UPI0011F79170|nr:MULTISPECIES: response regulator transcription factor [unclassified Sphingomonas]MBD8638496.1 response regulator transcription factor [Sphingomonas sp. CFBP 13733]MBD8700016.1 response regulator transcription factor [Sphingomonas sp. CFBP 13714]MBD8734149.1 response regulator transcription factor [Sphingomonas sp. CFBP 13706]RZM05439.1 MAG: response regulator transcription factor [Sphingomonas sp.]